MVETFFRTLKSELVWRTTFFTRADAERDIARYIDGFYNPVRRHSALDYLSPAQFEKQVVSCGNASPLYRGKSTTKTVTFQGSTSARPSFRSGTA